MRAKPEPRSPFGRTGHAPTLKFRAARTSKDKPQRKAVKWIEQYLKFKKFCVTVHLFIKRVHKTKNPFLKRVLNYEWNYEWNYERGRMFS